MERQSGTPMNLRHSPVLRHFFARPRLVLSIVAGISVYLLAPQQFTGEGATRLLVSWNVAVCLYLALAGAMMANASGATIRQRALEQDEGGKTLLLLVVLTALAMLLAIVVELSAVRGLAPQGRQGRILLGDRVRRVLIVHLRFLEKDILHFRFDCRINFPHNPDGLLL